MAFNYQLKNKDGMFTIVDRSGQVIASFMKEAAAREYLTFLFNGSGKKEKSIERSLRHISINTQNININLETLIKLAETVEE